MTVKVRLSLLFASFSLVLLVGTLGHIFISHSRSREAEFFDRLRDQCFRTATLLSQVKADDRDLLRVVDKNSIHKIFNEKVLVFNAADELIYSSLDDQRLPYSKPLLAEVRSGKEMAWKDPDGDEIVGVHFKDATHDYVVLASAFDEYGRRELANLRDTLLISLLLGALFIFGAGYFLIGLAFRPIDRLGKAIAQIDVDRLDQQLPVRQTKDEIDRLAAAYNAMLKRLREAFDLQRAFVRNASHELRTPLARMNAQLESAQRMPGGSPKLHDTLRTLQDDITEQAELVESLLLLQRLQSHMPLDRTAVRVDEAVFAALEEARLLHPKLHAEVDIAKDLTNDRQLVVMINEPLLRICFRNLLRNAASYSDDGHIRVELAPSKGMLTVTFINSGGHMLPAEQVFEPFYRGPSAESSPGSGLGLSIVRQVVQDAGGSVGYSFDGKHRFDLKLPTTA